MATKQELYDNLMRLTEENHLLKCENERFRSMLLTIYGQTRQVLGIEAAIQAREDEKQKQALNCTK